MIRIKNKTLFAAVEERLAEGQQVDLPLRGVSMKPTLREGDVLTLEPCSRPAVGDVVLFRYRGRHLLHRVIAIDGDTFTMQGDNCSSSETASSGDIVARLIAVRRGGKTIAVGSRRWLRTSRCALFRKRLKNFALRWLGARGRRQLRPWYFGILAFLMLAPLNGVDIPLDNYIIGLRADHLLHASVFIPCSLFFVDLFDDTRAPMRVTACICILAECTHYLLPYRAFDINDMLANLIGATFGWIVWCAYNFLSEFFVKP